MQKNEVTLLDPWVRYHGELFGFENLFVFDNGSSDEVITEILDDAEKRGVNVDRSHNSAQDFADKGRIIGEKMQTLRDGKDYDFLIPLDCDEFFCLQEDDGVTVNPSLIMARLRRLLDDPRLPNVEKNYLNVLGTRDQFLSAPYKKVFFQAESFVELEHGFHLGASSTSTEVVVTDFVYIHCHAKPFEMLVNHSRAKLELFCDVDDPGKLAEFESNKGIGWHLVKYLQMTESEYLTIFQSPLSVRIPSFADRLEQIGADTTFLLGGSPRSRAARPEIHRGCPGVFHLPARHDREHGNGVIVIGPAGTTTAVIMRALKHAGLDTGDEASMFLDRRWMTALFAGDRIAAKRWLLVRAAGKQQWGTWLPDFGALDSVALEALRRPRVIQLFHSNSIDDPEGAYSNAGRQIAELRRRDLESLVVDCSAAMHDPAGLAEVLVAFCGIEPTEERIAAATSALVGSVASSNVEGWIDLALPEAVHGWCWVKGSRSRPTVELYINGSKHAAAVADHARPDLATAGKSDGRFGFHLPYKKDTPDSGIVDVIMSVNGHKLDNSGLTLAELRKRAS